MKKGKKQSSAADGGGGDLKRLSDKLQLEAAARMAMAEQVPDCEKLFRNLMEYIPGVSVQGYKPDGTVFYWNKASEEVYGYSTAEALGRNLADLIVPPDLLSLFRQCLQVGKQVKQSGEFMPPGELLLLHKQGHRVPVYSIHTAVCIEGKDPLLFCIDVDLSERKKVEEALRESEEKFRTIFENVTDLITYVDKRGKILDVNKRIESLLGYKREEVVGRHFAALGVLRPRALPGIVSLFRKSIKKGKATSPIELELVHKNGDSVFVEVGTQFVMKNGTAEGVVNIFRDITERKQLEEQLRHSQKMEAVGQLAGGIAHDFNNQLTAIMGYAEMLSMKLEDDKLRRDAENIIRAAKRSADLTQQLLAFARKGKFRTAAVNIHKIIGEVVMLLEHSIDKRIGIQRLLKANPPVTVGDPTQLQNALLNLALNARDAMPEGGKIVFTTDVVMLDELFCRSHSNEVTPGPYLMVSVSDTGLGMDKETRKHIFEPFFTTKQHGAGTGMGLAAVYGTVKSHGGFIDVTSEPQRGSSFTIYLPLVETGEDEGEIPRKAQPSRGKEAARILVVDDEQDVRDVAVRMLRSLSYKVTTCANGVAAVEYYADSWEYIDLVILDMVMPDMDGRKTFLEMRKINPHVKALLSSGYSIDGEAQEILNEGVLGFLQKPFLLDELSRKVADVLEK